MNKERFIQAIRACLDGDFEAVVDVCVAHIPDPASAEHTSRLVVRRRPHADGWFFGSGGSAFAPMGVVLAPDGTPRAVRLTWPPGLVPGRLAPELSRDAFLLGSGDDGVALELGAPLAREIVDRADRLWLQTAPRAWGVMAGEAIRATIDADHRLLPYAPPGWSPGLTPRQRKLSDMLRKGDPVPETFAARVAELLLACGAPEVTFGGPPRVPPPWIGHVRFGDEVELIAAWEHLGETADEPRVVLNGDASIRLIATSLTADVAPLAPELVRALKARHRSFSEFPFD